MSFKDLLADVRIQKIEIDTAIASGIIRKGVRTTTGIKIFFALGNMDRYCLRIDFPHKGEAFLHYNLHEPGRENALPLNEKKYRLLAGKYKHLDELFFHFNNLYWFRSNFVSKLERIAPEKDSDEYANYLNFREELLEKSLQREKEKIKTKLLDILFRSYEEIVMQYGEYKDLAELSLKEILELVWEAVEDFD